MKQQRLVTDPNFTNADEFYQALNELFQGASAEESERINARLVLLLANHIGDSRVLAEAMAIAGEIKKASS